MDENSILVVSKVAESVVEVCVIGVFVDLGSTVVISEDIENVDSIVTEKVLSVAVIGVFVDIGSTVVISVNIDCVDCIETEKVLSVTVVLEAIVDAGIVEVGDLDVSAVGGADIVDNSTEVINGRVESVVDKTVAESDVEDTVDV